MAAMCTNRRRNAVRKLGFIALSATVVVFITSISFGWAAQSCPVRLAQAPAPQTAGQPGEAKSNVSIPNDALLLVIDAFNVVRMLEDSEFAAKRDEIARNLLRNLIPFLCAQQRTAPTPAATAPKPAQPTVPPAPRPSKPEKPSAPKPPAAPKPTQAKPASTSSTQAKPPASPHGPASAYAKVPQKKRIKRKFQAAREPFKKLQAENPEKAAIVADLLRAARAALASQKFDVAESYLDHALEMMGVPKPE